MPDVLAPSTFTQGDGIARCVARITTQKTPRISTCASSRARSSNVALSRLQASGARPGEVLPSITYRQFHEKLTELRSAQALLPAKVPRGPQKVRTAASLRPRLRYGSPCAFHRSLRAISSLTARARLPYLRPSHHMVPPERARAVDFDHHKYPGIVSYH